MLPSTRRVGDIEALLGDDNPVSRGNKPKPPAGLSKEPLWTRKPGQKTVIRMLPSNKTITIITPTDDELVRTWRSGISIKRQAEEHYSMNGINPFYATKRHQVSFLETQLSKMFEQHQVPVQSWEVELLGDLAFDDEASIELFASELEELLRRHNVDGEIWIDDGVEDEAA